MQKGRSLASKLWIWQPFEIRTPLGGEANLAPPPPLAESLDALNFAY